MMFKLLACLLTAIVAVGAATPAASAATPPPSGASAANPEPAGSGLRCRKHPSRPKCRNRQSPSPSPSPGGGGGGGGGGGNVEQQIRDAWEANDNKAVRVADCESSLNPRATSSGGTYLGLWQFSRATWHAYGGSGSDPREASAYDQTRVAWALYEERGWAPWPGCADA